MTALLSWIVRISLTLAFASIIATIWAPGDWWKWLMTSIVLLIVAAGASNAYTEHTKKN